MSCTAKTQYRKFETNIPRKGTAWPQSQFRHTCFFCERFLYILPRSVCLFCCMEIDGQMWAYIDHLKTHECGNWDWGRAIPFLGIHQSKFLCSVMFYIHIITVIRHKNKDTDFAEILKSFTRTFSLTLILCGWPFFVIREIGFYTSRWVLDRFELWRLRTLNSFQKFKFKFKKLKTYSEERPKIGHSSLNS